MPNTLKIQGSMKVQGGLYITTNIITNTLVWSGLGINNNWSTTTNWNLRTPINFDILQFAGTTRLTPFNDLAVDTNLNGVAFNAGAGAFAISGNRFILNAGDITNNSSNTQQINNDIVLGSSAGNINCNSAPMFLNRNISGTGNLTKTGSSSLTLSGNNSYTGNTFINNGFVSVFNSNPFGTGSVYLQTTAQWPILVQPTAAPATVVINNPIYSSYVAGGGGTLSLIYVGKSTTFNGPITFVTNSGIPNQNVQFTLGAPSITLTFNGGISGTPTWGSVLVNINGGTNTTVILSNSPVIFNSTAVNFGFIGVTTAIIAVSGNRFQTIRNIGSNIRCDVPFAINDDNITFGGTETINLNGYDQIFRSMNNGGTGNNIFNNSSTFANLTINPRNATNSIYNGSISGNINLIKTNQFSTLTLSGIPALNIGPRYTGFTAISGGILRVHALSSNPSNKVNYVDFLPTTLTVYFTTPPSIGDSFILLPGRTINSYPAVSLINATGRTASYNSTTSTLSVIS
jgi:autotransporter-associated beta strand protein